MKPNSITTYAPSGGSPLQSGATYSSRYSSFTHETVMETCHGLPGAEAEQPLIRRPAADYNRNEGTDLVYSAFCREEPHVEWYQVHPMTYQYPKLKNSYQLSPNNNERIQDDIFIKETTENFACEYTGSQTYESGVSVPTSIEPRFASGYLFDSLQQNCANGFMDLDGLDNFIMDSPADLEQLTLGQSPTMWNQTSSDSSPGFKVTPALVDTSSSKASDDGEGDVGDGNLPTIEGRISDAPYAKLIYKALMDAPNHSMVLQDIYQWFIDNTGKGSSASTGWRNSIRHNLSMNAAFRKTSRKSNGDDSKRTSEWVLEPFAVMEGVTPTTRYRKNGKKAYKSRISGPTRARSARSGGIRAGKSKSRSQQFPDSRQDMINDRPQHTPIQYCTPPVIDQANLSPCTPDCHQILPGSFYHTGTSFLDSWDQYADEKSVGGVGYMDKHEHYGDRYPYEWTNSQNC